MKAKKCCSGRFHNELSYEVNDLITVLIDVEDMSSQCAWWHGELRGRKGIFSIKLVESYNQENVRRKESEGEGGWGGGVGDKEKG